MTYNNFTGIAQCSKTIRNEIIPVGWTKQLIKNNEILESDEKRDEKSEELKKLMDDYYRTYIDGKLSPVRDLDWSELFEVLDVALKRGAKKEDRTKLQKVRKNMLEKVYAKLDVKANKEMLGGKMVTKILPDFIKNNAEYTDEEKEQYFDTIKLFKGFTTSLKKFLKTRENVFSEKDIPTSICYRIVWENADIFYKNIKAFEKIKESATQEIEKLEEECRQQSAEHSASQMFSAEFYNCVLTQTGIEFYNDVCGRINKHMNLYYQQTKEKTGRYLMKKLHKQILSISSTRYEVPHMYENDDEVYDSINSFVKRLKDDSKLKSMIGNLLKKSQLYDYDEIFVDAKRYESVSTTISGSWDTVVRCITRYYDENTVTKKDRQKKIENKVKNEKYRSLTGIYKVVMSYESREKFKSTNEYEYLHELEKIYNDDKLQLIEHYGSKKLIEDDVKIAEIKEMLDMLLKVRHFLDTFIEPEYENIDVDFYNEREEILEILDGIVALYNRVRNYVTQKPYSKDKYKLNFNCSSLGTGWSRNTEHSYKTIILRKNGLYYLGIYNAMNMPDEEIMEGNLGDVGDSYEKMVYGALPTRKLLNWCVTSDEAVKKYNPPQNIIDGCNNGRQGGNNFDINFCHELIDYLKACIKTNPKWSELKFNFSDTNKYGSLKDFYDEISEQGYKVSWVNIPKEDIERLNREGQIYLFQIYNKDFSDKSTGTPNLHTMYFKNIFSEENMREEVIMLNGGAELFFRKASIENKIEHKEGTVLVNKTYKEMIGGEEVRVPVPEKEYVEIYTYLNNGKSTKLSDSAQKLFDSGKIEYREAKKNITKDRRYTEDKFFLHIPITHNYKVTKNNIRLNEQVLDYISEQKNLHIIGIDRGERNLIYVSVIDMNGRIVKQKSYNIVSGYDYQKKLVEREIARDDARKSWKEVGKITDLKEGYLSQVVHEISQMVLEYNAVIAMEELNYGFKRGRFKVERQVYQKFETMLISKLNYLVDKKKKVDEPGGVLKGYQLTYVPEKVTDVGKQCGIIFYVPPAYTSKIDPTTGFVDLFDFKADKPRKFLSRFDSIRYVKAGEEQDMFAFSFDYDNFAIHNTTPVIKKWIAYTYGSRIKKKPDIKNGKRVYSYEKLELTDEMKKLLNQNEISYCDGHNIVDDIKALDDKEKEALTDGIFNLFRLTVQLRNSMSEAEDYDMIVSPIRNDSGEFFDSSKYKNDDFGKESVDMPKDADANGAYCIAMKCLFEMKKVQQGWSKSDKKNFDFLTVTNEDWFDFMQNKRYL